MRRTFFLIGGIVVRIVYDFKETLVGAVELFFVNGADTMQGGEKFRQNVA